MLDREKLVKNLFSIAPKLFPDLKNENDLAKQNWEKLSKDETFELRAQTSQSSFLIPRWEGNLSDVFEILPQTQDYSVVAVDGSQIYPDRHISGAGCFLINTGGVVLNYGKKSEAKFFCQPEVLLPQNLVTQIGMQNFSRDLVDLKREEYEFEETVKRALESAKNDPVCLIDGSIVFWPLEGKTPEIKKFFLKKYLSCLNELYENKILFAGYISMPKSKELVSLIKLNLCRFTVADCIKCHGQFDSFPCKQVDHLIDTQVARFFLKKNKKDLKKTRTTVFYSTSKITEFYPEHLKPAFVYCDVGAEIIRLEIPTWIAQQKSLLEKVCSIAVSQAEKGYGYPVCLAEAHEQAVVKGADREFFYHLLRKIGIDHNKKLRFSEKATKKRRIGI